LITTKSSRTTGSWTTPDRVYTTLSVVPERPTVQISILYFGEGREPPQLSLIGRSVTIIP
jgi:hypothetical protein